VSNERSYRRAGSNVTSDLCDGIQVGGKHNATTIIKKLNDPDVRPKVGVSNERSYLTSY